MNLPLPTDNMYKFLALFGLTVALAGSVFLYKKLTFLAEYNLAHIRRNAPLVYRINQLRAEISKIGRDSGKAGIEKTVLVKQLEQELEKNRALMEQEVAHFNNTLPWQLNWAPPAIVLGLACSAVGFALWYFRLQRYQDAMVKTASKPERKRIRKFTPPVRS